MTTKITGEQQVQILSPSFSISPSNENYVLNISADGINFSPLFAVSAGVTRLVSNVASGSYYKLVGNQSEVVINWERMCVQPSGGGGTTYTAGQYIDIAEDVISVTGITPDDYITSAYTGFTPIADFNSLSGIVQEQQTVFSSGYNELHTQVLELSANTSAITLAVSGKADAANVTANTNNTWFPAWNAQGVITGIADSAAVVQTKINNTPFNAYVDGTNYSINPFYAPVSAGTAGDILVSTGGIPVWSAITFISSADVETQIESKNYITSAYTGLTNLQNQIDTIDTVIPAAIIDINDRMVSSSSVDTIWKGSQAQYDALTNSGATADPSTFYIII